MVAKLSTLKKKIKAGKKLGFSKKHQLRQEVSLQERVVKTKVRR
jgi:hypothetical protein